MATRIECARCHIDARRLRGPFLQSLFNQEAHRVQRPRENFCAAYLLQVFDNHARIERYMRFTDRIGEGRVTKPLCAQIFST
jgi:hypothetical protein